MKEHEHSLIGPRTPVGYPAAGTPLSQNQEQTLFSFLYSTSRRSSVTLGGTVLATDLAAARHAASAAIIAKYPDGVLKVIEVARNSRFPVKSQDGWIAPGMLDGGIN